MENCNSSICELTLKRSITDFKKIQIKSSKDAYKFAKQFYSDDLTIYESVFLILLNRNNITIGYAKISQGGVSSSVVDPKILLKYCVESLASNCILVHNHPSGNITPSESDKMLTAKIKDGVKLFETKLLDHLIITTDTYFSFSDEGIL